MGVTGSSRISGDGLDGIYEGVFTLPQLSEVGTWHVAYVRVQDIVNNNGEYIENDLVSLGFPNTLTVTTLLAVAIDIKPGSYLNSINPKSKGKIPVAILSTEDFDAPYDVDMESLTFGSTGDQPSLAFCNPNGEDIDGDGLKDLVCHFFTQQTVFQCGDTVGILKGKIADNVPIKGSDSVRINPCK